MSKPFRVFPIPTPVDFLIETLTGCGTRDGAAGITGLGDQSAVISELPSEMQSTEFIITRSTPLRMQVDRYITSTEGLGLKDGVIQPFRT